MADTAPQRIGKYQITALLGQGAMGVVYLGQDPLLGRAVAIKVMSQGIATDEELRNRFLREARAAGSLQHPNIITIYDFGDAEGSLYIAMEYVEGSDLSEIIGRQDPLPLTGKIAIIIDALHALDYAHSRGVVHRDVKPANIRVSVDGHAKLMDFGIARLEKSDLTRSGIMIGTPDYMAPEQVTGGQITAATDVFAVGVVLYEFLTGKRTFEGETIHAVLYKVVSEQPPPLRDVTQGVPASLQPILDRALAKEVGHRYRSAGDMAADLEVVHRALSGGATVRVMARSTPLHTARIPRRPGLKTRKGRRVAVAVGAAVVVLAAAAAVVLGGRHARVPLPSAAPGAAAAGPTAPGVPAVPTGVESVAAAETGAVPPPAPGQAAKAQPGPDTIAESPAAEKPAVRGRRRIGTERAMQPGGGEAMVGRRRSPALDTLPKPATRPTPPQPAESTVVALAPLPVPRPVTPAAVPGGAAPAAAMTVPPAVPSSAAAAPAPAAPPADPRPELEALVAAYAAAIESRRVPDIQRVYPALTGDQARQWERFFQTARNVKVRLQVGRLGLGGDTADLVMTGGWEYDTDAGTQRAPLSIHATAAWSGAAWKLTEVR